jgi:hypothetical protein
MKSILAGCASYLFFNKLNINVSSAGSISTKTGLAISNSIQFTNSKVS